MIYTIYNNKGGVGKTTTSKMFANYLAEHNNKVLLIDMDPQGNLTNNLVKNELNSMGAITNDVYDLLLSEKELINCTLEVTDNIDIVPVYKYLENADTEIGNESNLKNPSIRLKKKLVNYKENYDYVIIDTPPALNHLSTNSLVSADEVVIPLTLDSYSISGIEKLLSRIETIKTEYNPNLKIKKIFLNQTTNSNLTKDVHDELLKHLGQLMYSDTVGNYTIIKNSTFDEVDIKKHKVSEQFSNLFKEVLV